MPFRSVFFVVLVLSPLSMAQSTTPPADPNQTAIPPAEPSQEVVPPRQPGQRPVTESPQERKKRAQEQLKAQEKQRILGIIPMFSTSNIPDAVPLSPRQKFSLAMKSALDPYQFGIAGIDAGISQWNNDFSGYGQGAQGYGKRFGAAYADNFDGALFGGAIFPILLHQDPRYFRKGTGSTSSRLWYAIGTTFRAKNDDGKWRPNYSNILGNIAAGGIANIYYPSTDRGVSLIFERAFTVTAEGAAGGVLLEFWPDISRHLFHHHQP